MEVAHTVATVIVAIAALIGVYFLWALRRLPNPALSKRVVVATRGPDSHTIEGILLREQGPLIILADARIYLTPGNAPVAMDGEVVLERDKLEWMQVVT